MVENKECTKCKQYQGSRNICIGGVGNTKATLMLINEYPTEEDDKNRTVFGGADSKIIFDVLTELLEVDPKTIYTTTLVKCRGNGEKPSVNEVDACLEYLNKEIEMVKPKAILTFGELCLSHICKKIGITKHRGNIFKYKDIPVVPTYSPTYLKYNSGALKDFASDFDKAIMCSMGMEQEKTQGTKVVYVKTHQEVIQLIEYMEQTKVCCFDFETLGVDTYIDINFDVNLIAFSFQHGSSYIIPWKHRESWFNEEDRAKILKVLDERVFQNPDITKINQNLKFEFHVLNFLGIPEIRGVVSDIMLMHHIIDELSKHSLEIQVEQVFKEYSGYKGNMKGKWGMANLKELGDYAGMDTDITLRLHTYYLSILIKDPKRYKLYRNLIIPALRTLYRTERRGALIDRPFLDNAIEETKKTAEKQLQTLKNFKKVKRFEKVQEEKKIRETIDKLEEQIKTHRDKRLNKDKPTLKESVHEVRWKKKIQDIKTGVEKVYEGINFASPDQLGELFYSSEGFGFPQPYDWKKGGETKSTAKPILLDMADKTGFIGELLVYRSVEKMLSTYLIGIRKRLDIHDKIHTSFMQTGTETGRLSSRDPNLQNIPRGSKLDHPVAIEVVARIKKAFIPPKDHYLVQVDYSQAELRIAASFAQEPRMLKVYQGDGDLHSVTAASLLKVSIEEFILLPDNVRKEARTKAKAGNFGIIYGISAEGFVNYAKDNYKVILTVREAQEMIDTFFRQYPNLLIWHQNYIMQAERQGYVSTLFGRRRHTPNILSSDNFLRGESERSAINSPVQGTAGEFTIFALSILENRLDPRIGISNTVHDSIVFYIPKDLMSYSIPIIQETCENLPMLQYFGVELKGVKMKVDVEYSEDNWKDLKPYKE